ncbi:MAG: ATP-binding cassette domain-containing protein, partial [Clostridia bacterium]|nr:ATP-binding cassette domain-containing protein [Clostridia bacterium]
MKQQNDVLLKVDHLCQYFRLGRKDLKAVDDVSFEIKKGEAFGLVGESGCGKTTTGRSIIKLYNITSGNVYFKGERVGAGTRSYKDAIKAASEDADVRIDRLIEAGYADPDKAEEYKAKIEEIENQLAAIVEKNRQLIREAKANTKEVDRRYSESLIKALEEEYAPKLKEAEKDPKALKALKKEFKTRCRVAKKSQLITQIQMIFQDPIASLDPRMTVREIIAEGLIIKGITDKDYINEKVYEILEMVGLVREHADRYPHEFSGGQRQRIGIARAIIMQPEMLIADEPISALDVSIQAQVINLLNDLR